MGPSKLGTLPYGHNTAEALGDEGLLLLFVGVNVDVNAISAVCRY